jgi:predicted RNase H-like HicB family nuclease
MKSWTVPVQQHEDGDYFIEFPEGVLESAGFSVGDTLNWDKRSDGSYVLTKKVDAPVETTVTEPEETELVLVDTVHQFRMRYMVEVPKGKSVWALDTVTCEEAKEFSQEFLGESIVSYRVVSEDEALSICDTDNEYTRSWTTEQKKRSFFTTREDLIK